MGGEQDGAASQKGPMFPVVGDCATARTAGGSGDLVCRSLIATNGVLGPTTLQPRATLALALSGFRVKLPAWCWVDSRAKS